MLPGIPTRWHGGPGIRRRGTLAVEILARRRMPWRIMSNGSRHCPANRCLSAIPAAFDFMFVYWYLIRFVGRSPFSFSALDIKTMAMVMLRKDYRRSTKNNMPKRWLDPVPHRHVALQDAIEQGALFCNMLSELRR